MTNINDPYILQLGMKEAWYIEIKNHDLKKAMHDFVVECNLKMGTDFMIILSKNEINNRKYLSDLLKDCKNLTNKSVVIINRGRKKCDTKNVTV